MNATVALGPDGGSAPTGGRLARPHDVLRTKTLVLNRSFLPIHVTSVRRACVLLYQGIARAVDEQYQTFDFGGWRSAAAQPAERPALGLVGGSMPVPRVIVLMTYDRVPRRHVRFTRHNVYARDHDTCQYCGRRFPRSELNLDHVVPRSQGGLSTWDNVVCSCHPCNRRKGGNTPEQSGIRLLKRPVRPAWTPLLGEVLGQTRYHEWRPFLSFLETANGDRSS
jgi:5-methylcytosine-specific restriction endonuclease McrA